MAAGDTYDALCITRWESEGGTVRGEDLESPRLLIQAQLHSLESVGSQFFLPSGKVSYSLNRKASMVAKPVYPTLAAHQADEIDWEYHGLYVFLDEWYTRFNERFRFHLPLVPIRLDQHIRRNCAGYFLPQHNEFGLVYEIGVAVPPPDQLNDIDHGELLGTLLHEQFHLLQELTGISGRNNYHNAQYRATTERFGLLVDHRGHQKYAADSLFLDLLAEFGVEPPFQVRVERATLRGENPPPASPPKKGPGQSKLRKWSCGCTNVRVGVAEFFAKCTRIECGKPFTPR